MKLPIGSSGLSVLTSLGECGKRGGLDSNHHRALSFGDLSDNFCSLGGQASGQDPFHGLGHYRPLPTGTDTYRIFFDSSFLL